VINGDHEKFTLKIFSGDGKQLLTYCSNDEENRSVPPPASGARDPKDIERIEELYLTGLHLEQYRHATFNPMDYYGEALSRDPGDARCNNALGLLYLRNGQFRKAQPFFEKAIETLTSWNPNPYDGEPHYNLGYCLKFQHKMDEAYGFLFKSAWNAAWKDPAYFTIAQIDCIRGDWESALDHIEQSLIRNWHNHKARQLKASILRKTEREEDAFVWIDASLDIDPFNVGILFEKYLLTRLIEQKRDIEELLQNNPHSYLEYALDFAAAGLYEEAIGLLQLPEKTVQPVYPIIFYAWGYFLFLQGEEEKAKELYEKAFGLSPDKCFPNRPEEMIILQHATEVNQTDWKAYYYLGNYWYSKKQYNEAIASWEKSAETNDTFPSVLRNLSLAYYNKLNRKNDALKLLEKAFSFDQNDSRMLMELDQLYKRMNYPPAERMAFLEAHIDLVEARDDLFIERITLYNQLGDYEKAKELLTQRQFHPWEGGEGKVTCQYTVCRIQLAKSAIEKEEFMLALKLLHETDVYPPNLGEGKLSTIKENDIEYYKGICYSGLNDEKNAVEWFQKATMGADEPAQVFFYNDENPDRIYFQGLAWRALGDEEKAQERFKKLIAYGEKHLNDACKIDYFAVSLPDLAIWEEDLNKRNQIHCFYVMALGWSGLGEAQRAEEFMERVTDLDVNHQGRRLFENRY